VTVFRVKFAATDTADRRRLARAILERTVANAVTRRPRRLSPDRDALTGMIRPREPTAARAARPAVTMTGSPLSPRARLAT
jgi:hypothetical protein